MKRFVCIFSTIVLLLTACKKTNPNAAIDEVLGYTLIFRTSDCKFDVPAGYNIVCGYVTVPEDRSQPKGATIRMHTAIFKSTNPNPAPDPVVHLYGGPGGSLLDNAADVNVMHIDINAEVALSAARAFDLIFTNCAADPACQSTYPDLETTFYRVVDMLNAKPMRVTLSRGTLFIDGDDMMDLVAMR